MDRNIENSPNYDKIELYVVYVAIFVFGSYDTHNES